MINLMTRFTQNAVEASCALRRTLIAVLVVLATIATPAFSALAQDTVSFSYLCTGGGIQFAMNGAAVISVSLSQLAPPLSAASVSGQSQPVASGGGASLWALASYALQIQHDSDPMGTMAVYNADLCGHISLVTNDQSAEQTQAAGPVAQTQLQAAAQPQSAQNNAPAQTNASAPNSGAPSNNIQTGALTQAGSGGAQAFAFANINGTIVMAFAQVLGDRAYAYAQALPGGNIPAAPSAQPASGARLHIVQVGEPLNVIAQRYGTTVQVLMALNGLTDPNRIFVGQQLIVP